MLLKETLLKVAVQETLMMKQPIFNIKQAFPPCCQKVHIYLVICIFVTRFLCDKGVKKMPLSFKTTKHYGHC